MSKSKLDGGNTDVTEDVKSQTAGTVHPIPKPPPPPKRIVLAIDTILVSSIIVLALSIFIRNQYQQSLEQAL